MNTFNSLLNLLFIFHEIVRNTVHDKVFFNSFLFGVAVQGLMQIPDDDLCIFTFVLTYYYRIGLVAVA
jgi:hypothetical protein